MKKLTNILLLILFAISIFFSISNNISSTSKTSDSSGYASIIPIPPPEPPARRGC
jgi:hypothetical protein